MDYIRRCYSIDCIFYKGQQVPTKIRWYFAAPGARNFPAPSVFWSKSKYEPFENTSDPGELTQHWRTYNDGKPPRPGLTGQHFEGTLADFLGEGHPPMSVMRPGGALPKNVPCLILPAEGVLGGSVHFWSLHTAIEGAVSCSTHFWTDATAAEGVLGGSVPWEAETCLEGVLGGSVPFYHSTALEGVLGGSVPITPQTSLEGVLGGSVPPYTFTAICGVLGWSVAPYSFTALEGVVCCGPTYSRVGVRFRAAAKDAIAGQIRLPLRLKFKALATAVVGVRPCPVRIKFKPAAIPVPPYVPHCPIRLRFDTPQPATNIRNDFGPAFEVWPLCPPYIPAVAGAFGVGGAAPVLAVGAGESPIKLKLDVGPVGPLVSVANAPIGLLLRAASIPTGVIDGAEPIKLKLDGTAENPLVVSGTWPIKLKLRASAIPIPLLNELIAWWGLHEAAGNPRLDSSGNGYTLTEVGGPIPTVTGVIGNAASLTGYLYNANPLMERPAISVSCWVQWAATDGYGGYFVANSPLGDRYFTFGGVGGGVGAQPADGIVGYNILAWSGWDHFAFTFDGTTLKLYVNGVYRATAAGASTATEAAGFAVGTRIQGLLTVPYENIQLVGLWSRALDDGGATLGNPAGGEIALLYNGGSGLDWPLY